MSDVVVRSGARVARSVRAEHVVVGRSARVGAANAKHPALIGVRRRVPSGQVIGAGEELAPRRPRDILGSAR
jgi:hypothetical protein